MTLRLSIALCALMLLSGCVLAPRETKQEQQRLDRAGVAFEPPVEKRDLPPLEDQITWRDALRRAFLANGELEAAYFEWKAALARIPQVANYPNTNIAPSFSYLFSGERMKSWDRTTVNVGFDPMQNLSFPTKVIQAAKIAFDQARAAGDKFSAAKFDLQRKVLTAYLDYALAAEKARIQEENVSLLQLIVQSADTRVQAGAPQQDLLKAQVQMRLAENELGNTQAELSRMRAMLNGLLARP